MRGVAGARIGVSRFMAIADYELAATKADLQELKADLQELREEFLKFKIEILERIHQLEQQMEQRFHALEQRSDRLLYIVVILFLIFNSDKVIGLVQALMRLTGR